MKLALDRMETFAALAMQALIASGDEADDAELVEIAWSIAAAMETKAIKRHERLKAVVAPAAEPRTAEAKPAVRRGISHEEQLVLWLKTDPKVGSHKAYLEWAAVNKIGPMMGKAAFSALISFAPPKDLTSDEQYDAWREAEPNGNDFGQFHQWAVGNRMVQHMGRKQFEMLRRTRPVEVAKAKLPIAPAPVAPPPPPPAPVAAFRCARCKGGHAPGMKSWHVGIKTVCGVCVLPLDIKGREAK